MEEYWDIYDQNRVLQNRTIRRGDPFQPGDYYVCCEVWIRNSKGEFLMTQRHPDKKAGGLWEFTGGGVLAGETTERAAAREVKEELGISIAEQELTLLATHRQKNYFMDIYLVKRDAEIRDLALDKTETVDARWVSKEELQAMMEEQKVVYSVSQRYRLYGSP